MKISIETQKQINELSNIDNRILIESQINNDEVLIAITINKSLIKFEKEPLDIIRFMLQIKSTYPETPPLLYCISRFCIPELCDGRDFLEDTLQMKWDKNSCFLKLIISQIPSFVQRYLNYINGTNIINNIILKRKMFGKFYLDAIYETSIIKYIPYLYFNTISEVVSIEGKKMFLEDRKLLITDNFLLLFCPKNLYEIDKLKLVFVGPITSLLYIRQFYKDEIVLLKWIIKGKGLQSSSYTMQFKTQDGDYIVDTLIDNLSKRSINFKVTKTINGNIKREGTVPMVEINLVEEEIKNIEKKIKNKENITKESISILINLYEKAIQYYSALNNKRFEIFIKKIHEVYSNTEYTSLLNMKTVSNANNQYKTGINNENVLDIKDNNNAEKEKKESENNIDNENINNIKNENEDEPKEEIIKEENNNKINNKDDKIKPEINTTKKSDEIEKEEKKEVKNETKKRPKRNLKKKEEKQKEEKEKINSMEKEISQRMILDKKEIEEMLKNEINIGNENKEKNINDKEKDDIKSDDKREENM